MRQRLVFEVGDDLFDDGVIAMLGLDQRELLGALGDEREVPPASSSIASTAARTALIMRTPMEYCQPARSRRSKTFVFQNPESARSSLTPRPPS